MCETCAIGEGWNGWLDLPGRTIGKPLGDWIDLSYPYGPDMPCASIFPRPSFSMLRSMPEHPFNVTEIRAAAHAGTHVDSPRHYYLDGPAFEDIAFDRLQGPGVVWHIAAEPDEVISVEKLQAARPHLRPGDILALDTGWADRFGTPEYELHPSLSPAAAEWLLAQQIKLLACDFATPDLVYHLRQPGFDWPVHRTLLSHGILICEHLRGHKVLAGGHAEFIFAALNVVASDGAPARVIARPVAA